MKTFFIIFGALALGVFIILFTIAMIKGEPFLLPVMITFLIFGVSFLLTGTVVTETYNCPQCNEEVSKQADYCFHCGNALDTKGADEATEIFTCKCGKNYNNCENINYCEQCGEQIHKTYCNGCGKRISSETFCPECGLDLRVDSNISNVSK